MNGRWAWLIWPGTRDLWHGRSLAGLAWSLGFSWLAILALTVQFVFPEMLTAWLRGLVWAGLGAVWVAHAVLMVRRFRQRDAGPDEDTKDQQCLAAIEHLLKGDLSQAQQILDSLVQRVPDDPGILIPSAMIARELKDPLKTRRLLRRALIEEPGPVWRWMAEQLASDQLAEYTLVTVA